MPTAGLIGSHENEKSKVNYTIVAPTTFHPFTVYQLTITLHDPEHELTSPVLIRSQIEDAEDERNYISEHSIHVAPNTTEMITINVDELPIERQYKVVVLGLTGLRFRHEANLLIQSRTYVLLIQTDKAIYRAGDTVKFRVIVLDSLLKPADIHFNEQLDIFVSDSARNRVKQWNNVKGTKGVFSDEFQLSDAPNFGDWTITATVHEETVEKTIEVAKYVLPKFEITIDSPDYFVVKDQKISAFVNAQYAYGKPMTGCAKVQLFTKHDEVLVEKNVEVKNGKGLIEFDFEAEIRPKIYDFCFGTYKIQATITEDLTGFSQTTTKAVTVHKDSYVIKMRSVENQYITDEPFKKTVSVRKHDGLPLKIHENNRRITLVRKTGVTTGDVGNYKEETFKTTHDYELDEDGNLQLSTVYTKDDHWVKYSAIYLGEEYYLNHFSLRNKNGHNVERIQAEVLTSQPTIGQVVAIQVSSCEVLTHFTYILISRKKIIAAKTVSIPDNQTKTHTFSFPADNDMTPAVKVLIYVVKADGIWSTRLNIDLRGELHNFVDLSLSKAQAQPGDEIDVNVKTNPKSYVGLLGVDEKLLLLKSGNDIDGKEALRKMYNIFWKTYPYHEGHDDFLNYWADFKHLDIILFTNVIPPPVATKRRGSKRLSGPKHDVGHLRALEELPAPTIRKKFAETWLWDAMTDEDFNGTWNLNKTVPNSLTNWVVTAFAIDPETGFGVNGKPATLTVSKPLTVSLNLPHSVKCGEVLTIPCAVINSSENEICGEITLENVNREFELVNDAPHTKDLQVKGKHNAVFNFAIKPSHVGKIPIKVVVKALGDTNEVVQVLNVEAEGITQYSNKSVFVDLREKSELESTSITIDIPDTVIPDSARIEVTGLGDILGSCIENLPNLIRKPSGSGEQNMIGFVPNAVVLNYLKNTEQLKPEIESKVKRFLDVSYQHQLKYRHHDGSFGVFGRATGNGSTWITAYVIKSFLQVANYISIESVVIDQGLEFLSKTQRDDGSFVENGNVFCNDLQGGSSKLALTAYVLTAFVEYKSDKTKYQKVIDKAVKNINELIKTTNDTYTIAVAAYALQQVDHITKDEVLQILLNKAQTSDDVKWWADQNDSSSAIVLKTSYALLALLKTQRTADTLPIVRYLLSQRNKEGGFSGTQDTVLGIQALATFAQTVANTQKNIDLTIKSDVDNTEKRLTVNKTNALASQNVTVPSTTKAITLNASGQGFAFVEVAYRYNIKIPDPKPDFRLDVKVKPLNEEVFELDIKTNYQPSIQAKDKGQSNVVVLEANLPSGYVVDTNALEGLQTGNGVIKKVESRCDDTVAVVYFEHLSFKTITFKLNAFRLHDVADRKPVPVVIYDCYDSDLKAQQFYSLP